MNNKNLVIGSALTLSASAVFFFLQSSSVTTENVTANNAINSVNTNKSSLTSVDEKKSNISNDALSSKQHASAKKQVDHNSHFDIESRIEKMSEWMDISEFSKEDILAAVASPVLFDLDAAVEPDALPLDDEEKSDGRRFFQASQARVAVLMPGDQLSVPVPDIDETYNMTVEQVGVKGSGVVNWKGRLDNGDGSFSLTRGSNFVAGHINTSKNTYSFEMHGDTGWIHESGALFTAELPPVVDDDHHHHHGEETQHLGSDGEVVIVNGSNSLSAVNHDGDDAVE